MSFQGTDPIAFALFLGTLSLLPLLIITTTAYMKISIVLNIVKNALGVQQVPPGMAVAGIAMAATFFVMAPTFMQIKGNLDERDVSLYQLKGLSVDETVATLEPLRTFMLGHTTEEQRKTFKDIAISRWDKGIAEQVTDKDYFILIPAFVVTELKLAFQIGFILYVPFVVIDLLVSNILLALGMQMVSPMTVALPIKILLFVSVDGWRKLIEGLILSY